MPQAICRCGHRLTLSENTDQRVTCPGCGARVRVRVSAQPPAPVKDGFIRFYCECGRRLKVSARNRPTQGQCPDCGRVVPIPEADPEGSLPPGHPETPTAELSVLERETLNRWVQSHIQHASTANSPPVGLADLPPSGAARQASPKDPSTILSTPALHPGRVEHGIRTCPGCGSPVHIQAETCRNCGASVPRR